MNDWAPLLWFRYNVITHFFRYAAYLERHEFCDAATNNLSDQENWTIHLVDMLGTEEQFTAFEAKAPLRAVILGSALQRALDDAVAPEHPDLEKRINIVTEQALPAAQKKLIESVVSPTSHPDDRDYAFKLLLLLGTESQLRKLAITVANLANEPHTTSVLGKLGAIKSLQELNLSQTMLSREGTGFLANLTNLIKLDLSDTKIMSSSLTPLRSLSALQDLDLSGTQVNESALPTFQHLGALKKLDVRDTALVASKEALANLLPDCEIISGR